METTISVGLGELAISRNPEEILVAYGLGSCVGIAMYCPKVHLAGLLHAVLPERMDGNEETITKYADSGIKTMIDRMIKEGADLRNTNIWMAGGANMLISTALSKTFDIGTRNVTSAVKTLSELHLKIVSQEVGGNSGRTVRLYVATGKMTVRVIGGQEKEM
jgi:chemotaxis protein CheD